MNLAGDVNRLVKILEDLDHVIVASQALVQTLVPHRDSIFIRLEEVTRPAQQALPSIPTQARPRFIGPGFVYQGSYTRTSAGIDVYRGLLRRLWAEFPSQREAMAAALGRWGHSRCYVAKDRQLLFTDKAETWARKFSTELCIGWYADTNLNPSRIRKLLPHAVRAVGLEWGKDVVVYWRRTPVDGI